jgi:hypothetical protein
MEMALTPVTCVFTNILVAAGHNWEVISMEKQRMTYRADLYPYQQTEAVSPLELPATTGMALMPVTCGSTNILVAAGLQLGK